MKRIVRTVAVLLFAAALLSTLLACNKRPKNEVVYSSGLEYTTNYDGTCALSGIGTCTDTDIRVPETSPDGDAVTSVAPHAFKDQTEIVKVTLPWSVSVIGSYAFSGCTSLASFILPDRVTELGDFAFRGCSAMKSIYMGAALKTIGDSVFHACNGLRSAFYRGVSADWKKISVGSGNSALTTGATIYYYSERYPTQSGYWWHIQNGTITVWQ